MGLIIAQKPATKQMAKIIMNLPAWTAIGVSEYVGLVALDPIRSGYLKEEYRVQNMMPTQNR
jgi:hypothetical protein